MKHGICLLLLVWMPFYCVNAQSLSADTGSLARIKANYIRSLVSMDREKQAYLQLLSAFPAEEEVSDQNIVELYQHYPVEHRVAEQLVRTLKADGSWPDIRYDDKKRSGWEPKKHAERILALTKYYYTSRYHGAGADVEGLEEAIHRALDFWFHRKFSCLNWWYNQIGVPRTLGPAFLLFEAELTPEEKQLAIREMAYSRFGMTGQNKVWLAGNVLIRGLLQDDYLLVKAARDTIVSEITLGKTEGIQCDWSFHQHGPQQQFGNYGLSFLSNMCTYAGLFARTPLALSAEQQRILFSLFREGYRWIVWRGYWDVNALNRQLFHNADVHKSYTLLFALHALMEGSTAAQAREIRRFIRANFLSPRSKNNLVGNKVFWDSDQTIHRRPHWMASVKMASERVIGTELVNEDNKQGLYMADGAMYVYTEGTEYHNIFPFWDWRKIPGITCKESDAPIPLRSGSEVRNRSAFVGGVTDGVTGITAMELNREGVRAHKAWIFTDEYVLCLGADVFADHQPLTTAVEQTLSAGELYRCTAGGEWETVSEEEGVVEQPARFFHRNTGYIILQADTCVARLEECSGQWFDVMGMYKPEMLRQEIMTLFIKHDRQQAATYQYVVLPASTMKRVKDFDIGKFTVLRNDKDVQAVAIGKKVYIAAYQPCEITLPKGKTLRIDKPGIVIQESLKSIKSVKSLKSCGSRGELTIDN